MEITLKTLSEATAQEVFDHVKNHLLTQNKKSMNEVEGCLYRNGDLKCAAGCLISDEEYRSDFENSTWGKLVSDGLVPRVHSQLIVELQNVHDDNDTTFWEERLKSISKTFKLIWK